MPPVVPQEEGTERRSRGRGRPKTRGRGGSSSRASSPLLQSKRLVATKSENNPSFSSRRAANQFDSHADGSDDESGSEDESGPFPERFPIARRLEKTRKPSLQSSPPTPLVCVDRSSPASSKTRSRRPDKRSAPEESARPVKKKRLGDSRDVGNASPSAAVDQSEPVLDYMKRSNPPGKKRVVGAPKRNRKEQMSTRDQVQASRDVASAMGVDVFDSDEDRCGLFTSKRQRRENGAGEVNEGLGAKGSVGADDIDNDDDDADVETLQVVDGSTTDDAAGEPVDNRHAGGERAPRPSFLMQRRGPRRPGLLSLSGRSRPTARTTGSNSSRTCVQSGGRAMQRISVAPDDRTQQRLVEEEWGRFPERENAGDVGQQPQAGSALVRLTRSTDLKPRDFTLYERRKFRDTGYDEAMRNERDLFMAACNAIASESCDAERTAEQVASRARTNGYGEASVTMEDFDVTRASASGARGDDSTCCYPTRTNLRCRYDHHRFASIPILLPVRYYATKNVVTFVADVVFCSFSCALAYIERDMARYHASTRNDRRQMLTMFARRFFGVTEPLRPAPFIEQHVDYGGRLTTEQFRALGVTHCSFVQYPMAASVPARFVTEIVLHKRVDRAKRQGLHLRVEQQHMHAVPAEPTDPAARVGGNKDKKKKERVATDSEGKRVVIDRSYVDNAIRRAAERRKRQPKEKHALQSFMKISEVTYSPGAKRKKR